MPSKLGLRLILVMLLGLLYLVASHWFMTEGKNFAWSTVAVVGPLLLAIAVGSWRLKNRLLAALSGLVLLALCGLAAAQIRVPAPWLFTAQHVGIHLFLAAGFAGTLRAGQTALITLLARQVHREITPAIAAYTRQLTGIWVVYFVGMAVLSLALFALAPFDIWALFANVLTPLSLAIFFVAEHLIRYWLHPEFERVSLSVAIQSYINSGKAATTPTHPKA
jgi:uncharacterized membrane protein